MTESKRPGGRRSEGMTTTIALLVEHADASPFGLGGQHYPRVRVIAKLHAAPAIRQSSITVDHDCDRPGVFLCRVRPDAADTRQLNADEATELSALVERAAYPLSVDTTPAGHAPRLSLRVKRDSLSDSSFSWTAGSHEALQSLEDLARELLSRAGTSGQAALRWLGRTASEDTPAGEWVGEARRRPRWPPDLDAAESAEVVQEVIDLVRGLGDLVDVMEVVKVLEESGRELPDLELLSHHLDVVGPSSLPDLQAQHWYHLLVLLDEVDRLRAHRYDGCMSCLARGSRPARRRAREDFVVSSRSIKAIVASAERKFRMRVLADAQRAGLEPVRRTRK